MLYLLISISYWFILEVQHFLCNFIFVVIYTKDNVKIDNCKLGNFEIFVSFMLMRTKNSNTKLPQKYAYFLKCKAYKDFFIYQIKK